MGILFFILIVIIIYFVYKKYNINYNESAAKDILLRKYMDGQIDEDTYLRMKMNLEEEK